MTKEFDIIVAGGGISGLTAGLTAARLGRSVVVLTGDTLGGHLLSIERIDGCPGFADGAAGYDLCPTVQEQASDAGAAFEMVPVLSLATDSGIWRVATPGGEYSAPAVVVATGTRLRSLDVPGESLLRGKGVSQCASCDAPLLRGQEVIVAGGGDSAMQEALTLADHCSKVTIVHHGESLSGQAAYRNAIEANPKIVREPRSEIAEILGADAVTGARLAREDGDETFDIDCAAVFVFVGLAPATDFLGDAAPLDEAGYIIADASFRTRQEGLFAAGTVRSGGIARAASAAGEGAAASVAADRFLRDRVWPS